MFKKNKLNNKATFKVLFTHTHFAYMEKQFFFSENLKFLKPFRLKMSL